VGPQVTAPWNTGHRGLPRLDGRSEHADVVSEGAVDGDLQAEG
jgi:hypothetical protein